MNGYNESVVLISIECLNKLRRKSHRLQSLDEPGLQDGEERPKAIPDPSLPPEDHLIRKERIAAVRAAIDELPENQRLAVILRRYDDFPYVQIAATLNTSEKAVKSLLNRAKEHLQKKLAPWDEIEPNPFYVSRFFARVAERRPWHAKWIDVLKGILTLRRLLLIMAAAGLVVLIRISVTQMQQRTAEDTRLAAIQFNGVDPELCESIEIADNFELINEWEFLSDMEIIQELEAIEAS